MEQEQMTVAYCGQLETSVVLGHVDGVAVGQMDGQEGLGAQRGQANPHLHSLPPVSPQKLFLVA